MRSAGQPSLRPWPWRQRHRLQAARRPLIERLASPLDDMLQVLIEESALGIAVMDQDGRLVRVNEALRRMVDQECDIAPGRPVQDIFCEQQRGGLWKELAPVLQGHRPSRSFTSTLRGKGSTSEHMVEISAVALREVDGTVSGAIFHVADISAQKRLEAQLAQSRKLQAIGQLASGIAHDFSNLLTAIIGASDDLLSRVALDGDLAEDLRLVRSSAERGTDLVRQLLAFGRQQTLQPRAVSINDAVQSLTGLLRRLLGGAIRLELELDQSGCTVRVDPTQLDQVVVNLAVNARDAMVEGGRLTLRTGQVTLSQALAQQAAEVPPGCYVMLEVQDTGCGIPPEVLPRIFDPFFTTRRERGGTGLGLSTVQEIIRRSNGFLVVESLPNQGTQVRVYLPRQDSEQTSMPACLPPFDHAAPASAATPMPVPVPAERATLLLVDDEDGVRRLATRALTRRGWAVLSAESGEAALALITGNAAANTLCALISDVVMPGMDGVALVRAVRQLRPGLPAILASGYAEDTLRGELAAEEIAFLAKPYASEDIFAVLDAQMAREKVRPGAGRHVPAGT